MKVHRLIFINRVTDGRQLAAIEDTVAMAAAVHEMQAASDAVSCLEAGKPFLFDETLAGVRIHGRLTPAHAISRQGMERRRQEGKL